MVEGSTFDGGGAHYEVLWRECIRPRLGDPEIRAVSLANRMLRGIMRERDAWSRRLVDRFGVIVPGMHRRDAYLCCLYEERLGSEAGVARLLEGPINTTVRFFRLVSPDFQSDHLADFATGLLERIETPRQAGLLMRRFHRLWQSGDTLKRLALFAPWHVLSHIATCNTCRPQHGQLFDDVHSWDGWHPDAFALPSEYLSFGPYRHVGEPVDNSLFRLAYLRLGRLRDGEIGDVNLRFWEEAGIPLDAFCRAYRRFGGLPAGLVSREQGCSEAFRERLTQGVTTARGVSEVVGCLPVIAQILQGDASRREGGFRDRFRSSLVLAVVDGEQAASVLTHYHELSRPPSEIKHLDKLAAYNKEAFVSHLERCNECLPIGWQVFASQQGWSEDLGPRIGQLLHQVLDRREVAHLAGLSKRDYLMKQRHFLMTIGRAAAYLRPGDPKLQLRILDLGTQVTKYKRSDEERKEAASGVTLVRPTVAEIPMYVRMHAQRRVVLFFLMCVAVYEDGYTYAPGDAVEQIGEGSKARGTHACHSALLHSVRRRRDRGPWERGRFREVFARTEFGRSLATTVELPTAINLEIDLWLEKRMRDPACDILTRVANPTDPLDPQGGVLEFCALFEQKAEIRAARLAEKGNPNVCEYLRLQRAETLLLAGRTDQLCESVIRLEGQIESEWRWPDLNPIRRHLGFVMLRGEMLRRRI